MIKRYMRLFLELIKIKISIPVAFLAFLGYSMLNRHFSTHGLLLALGVLLLAGAASAINQVIEAGYDNKMERTRKRPIPSGQISISYALFISFLVAFLGMYILLLYNHLVLVLGLLTFVWYIGVYTLLKRVSAFAVIPGSLTGALPPMIGWAAAGGNIFDPVILYVALFVFIWQIPHFWLLTLLYAKDYKKAGFPSMADLFSESQIRKWTFTWIVFGLIFSAMAIFWTQSVLYIFIHLSLIFAVGYFSYMYLISKPEPKNYKNLFHLINSMMVILLFFQVIFG